MLAFPCYRAFAVMCFLTEAVAACLSLPQGVRAAVAALAFIEAKKSLQRAAGWCSATPGWRREWQQAGEEEEEGAWEEGEQGPDLEQEDFGQSGWGEHTG